MDENVHLHEGERLLCSLCPTGALLLRLLCRSVADAVMAGVVLAALVIAGFLLRGSDFPSIWLLAVPALLVLLLDGWLRYGTWRDSMFRVTTERMLIEMPSSVSRRSLVTIRWDQYQESTASGSKAFDLFFRSKSLRIRYGTPDSGQIVVYPSLPRAKDLKHYLDKADSAIRRKDIDGLRPFVPKPKGQRD